MSDRRHALIALFAGLFLTGCAATPVGAMKTVPPDRVTAAYPTVRSQMPTSRIILHADTLRRFANEPVVFSGNVVARLPHARQHADRTDVYLSNDSDHLLRTVSSGHVRIVTRDCRIGTAHMAEYDERQQRVVLKGDARVARKDEIVVGTVIAIDLFPYGSVVRGGTPVFPRLPPRRFETCLSPHEPWT